MTPILHTRTWCRSCDVAIAIYKSIHECDDAQFASRVIANALTIPETVAAGLSTDSDVKREERLRHCAEALAVLQTQLYLACECGLLEREFSYRLATDARDVAEMIVALRNPTS